MLLQDAKRESYAWAVKNGQFIENYDGAQEIVNKAERQVADGQRYTYHLVRGYVTSLTRIVVD